jgi:hypothetical protein
VDEDAIFKGDDEVMTCVFNLIVYMPGNTFLSVAWVTSERIFMDSES